MEYLVEHGAPREKLLLGIPFYGQSFTLARHDGSYAFGNKATGAGDPGEYTKQPGMLAYFEICNKSKLKTHVPSMQIFKNPILFPVRKNRWNVVKDQFRSSGPFTYSRDQWVGFDDTKAVMDKAQYVMKNNYGGVAAWTIDLDDFMNRCCFEAFPLLKAINRGLKRIDDPEPAVGDCTKPPEPVTPPAPLLTTGVDTGAILSTTPMHHHEEEYTTRKTTTTTWPSWTQSTTKQTTTTEMDEMEEEEEKVEIATTLKPTTTKRPTRKPTTTTKPTTTPKPITTTRRTSK